ncbi:MAG: spore coat U domain-containing protein [Myxococcota bacterium]
MRLSFMRRSAVVCGAFLGLAIGAAPASAEGTVAANLGVGADVSANCLISTTYVELGDYDPVFTNASSPLDGTGKVTVTCTSGASAVITLGQGSFAAAGSDDAPARRMSDGNGHFIAYALYQDSGSTIWGNTPQTGVPYVGLGFASDVTVYGRAAAGQNVPAGSYEDTVVATVTF